jgi:ATP-dependent DNA helicase RecG
MTCWALGCTRGDEGRPDFSSRTPCGAPSSQVADSRQTHCTRDFSALYWHWMSSEGPALSPPPTEKQMAFDWEEVERNRYEPTRLYESPTEALLTGLPEGQHFDRKSARISPASLAETICAFSNSDARGGVIAVGIRDRILEGFKEVGEQALNDLLHTHYMHCPQAMCHYKPVSLGDKTVLLIRVDYHPHRVVELSNGTVYLRSGDRNRRLSAEEIVRLRHDKGEVPFELEPVEGASVDDLDEALVREFAEAVRRAESLEFDRSDFDILVQRHLARPKRGTFQPFVAAVLLFGRDPVRFFPGCKVRFIRYEGTEERTGQELNVIKDVLVEGSVPTQIKRAAEVVFSQLREFQALQPDGRFSVVPEYPPDCVYEAIVNACVHRSYSAKNMNIFVRMFDDRLEVESPGGFVPPVTAENIHEQHVPRNPILMDALRYLRFVRCANEGVRRMRHLMEESGLPMPKFHQESDRMSKVQVTLSNVNEQRKTWIDRDLTRHVGETLAKSLTGEEKRVLNYLAETRRMTVSDAHRVTGLKTWPSARKLMDGLLRKGLVKEIKTKVRDPKAHFVLADVWQPNGGR